MDPAPISQLKALLVLNERILGRILWYKTFTQVIPPQTGLNAGTETLFYSWNLCHTATICFWTCYFLALYILSTLDCHSHVEIPLSVYPISVIQDWVLGDNAARPHHRALGPLPECSWPNISSPVSTDLFVPLDGSLWLFLDFPIKIRSGASSRSLWRGAQLYCFLKFR